MLLDDERHVIKWLSQYGALTKTQVIRLLRDKTPETAEKILRNLKREHQISDVAGGYYLALDGLCKPDQRTILAVWVLLRFIDYVDPMAHYPAVYPSQIFFLKENTGYEIVVLYDGEQHLSKLLQPQDDEMKYKEVIFEAEHIDFVACDGYDAMKYLLFCPSYPWHISCPCPASQARRLHLPAENKEAGIHSRPMH